MSEDKRVELGCSDVRAKKRGKEEILGSTSPTIYTWRTIGYWNKGDVAQAHD